MQTGSEDINLVVLGAHRRAWSPADGTIIEVRPDFFELHQKGGAIRPGEPETPGNTLNLCRQRRCTKVLEQLAEPTDLGFFGAQSGAVKDGCLQIGQDETQDICALSNRVLSGFVAENVPVAIKPKRIFGSEHVAAAFNPLDDLRHEFLYPVSHLVVEIRGFLVGTD